MLISLAIVIHWSCPCGEKGPLSAGLELELRHVSDQDILLISIFLEKDLITR